MKFYVIDWGRWIQIGHKNGRELGGYLAVRRGRPFQIRLVKTMGWKVKKVWDDLKWNNLSETEWEWLKMNDNEVLFHQKWLK